MNFTRRQFLECIAAGGFVVAGELWFPGTRKIFIPSGTDFLNEYHLLLEWPTGRIIASMRHPIRPSEEPSDPRDLILNFGLGHKTGMIHKIQLSHGRGVLPFENPLPVNKGDGVIISASISDGDFIIS